MKSMRCGVGFAVLSLLLLLFGQCTAAQAIVETVTPLLEKPVQPTAVTAYQLQTYMMKHIAKPVALATAEQWTAEARKLRRHILDDIAYHGWPQEWVNATPHFEQKEVIERFCTSRKRSMAEYQRSLILSDTIRWETWWNTSRNDASISRDKAFLL
jgi:hypothetical protein